MSTRKPIENGDFIRISNDKLPKYQAVFCGVLKIGEGYEVMAIRTARPRMYHLSVPRHLEWVAVYAKDCKLHHRRKVEKEDEAA